MEFIYFNLNALNINNIMIWNLASNSIIHIKATVTELYDIGNPWLADLSCVMKMWNIIFMKYFILLSGFFLGLIECVGLVFLIAWTINGWTEYFRKWQSIFHQLGCLKKILTQLDGWFKMADNTLFFRPSSVNAV